MAQKKEAEKADETAAGGGNKKLIIIIAAAVVLLLVIGGVAAFLFWPKPPPEEPKDPGQDVPVPELTQQVEIGPMINVEKVIVNIAADDANDTKHLVQATFSLELSGENAVEEVTKYMPPIRDAINLLLSSQKYEDLLDLQGKMQLKAELLNKINSLLPPNKVRVKSIYFTDFVVQ